MQRLPQLIAKIESLGDLRELFRAMRAVAANHLQQSQATLAGIRRYTRAIEGAIAQAALLAAETGEPLPPPEAGDGGDGGVLLVACSEHGFTGGFNERLLDAAIEARLPGDRLGVIGSRGVVRARERGLDVDITLAMATHLGGVAATARQAAGRLAAAPRARIVAARYRQGAAYDVAVRPVLPLDPRLLSGPASARRPLHHLDPAVLLAELAAEYLYAETIAALTESFACQNAARLRLMEAADRNIEDRLATMHRDAQALRQRQITTELLDVVVGAEAVLAAAGPAAAGDR